MRRVSFVRVLLSDDGVACQAVGTANRRPAVRPVSLATAAALAASGIPTIVRSRREGAPSARMPGS